MSKDKVDFQILVVDRLISYLADMRHGDKKLNSGAEITTSGGWLTCRDYTVAPVVRMETRKAVTNFPRWSGFL